MKRITILIVLCFPLIAQACDVCNLYIGIQPNDYKNTLGIIYRSRNLHRVFVYDENNHLVRHVQNISSTTEIWQRYKVFDLQGRYYLNKKSYLMGSVPVVNNRHVQNDSIITQVTGLGDITLTYNYLLLEKMKKEGNKTSLQRIYAGLGFKAPIGSKRLTYNDQLAEIEMQGSSGSWDFLGLIQYQALFGNFGILQINSFKWNSTGTDHYRFGNAFNHNLMLFRKIEIRKALTIAPLTGLFFEGALKDRWNNQLQQSSGGWVLLGSYGMNLYTKKFSLQLNWQPSYINHYPDLQLPVKNRWVAGLTFNL